MKYLVDLNYTLVGNSPKWGEPRITPFSRQIEQETYRQWLVDFLKDKYAILITARPARYREQTLERILSQTGWQPQEAYFAEISAPPPEIKENVAQQQIFLDFRTAARNQGRFAVALHFPKTRQEWRGFLRDRKQSQNKGNVQKIWYKIAKIFRFQETNR